MDLNEREKNSNSDAFSVDLKYSNGQSAKIDIVILSALKFDLAHMSFYGYEHEGNMSISRDIYVNFFGNEASVLMGDNTSEVKIGSVYTGGDLGQLSEQQVRLFFDCSLELQIASCLSGRVGLKNE